MTDYVENIEKFSSGQTDLMLPEIRKAISVLVKIRESIKKKGGDPEEDG